MTCSEDELGGDGPIAHIAETDDVIAWTVG